MWIWIPLGVGILLLFISAVLQEYCEFSKQALPKLRPRIFETRLRFLLQAGWILLLLVGGALLFLPVWFISLFWVVAVGALVVYWLLLPLSIRPRLRKRLLPPWDDIKRDLVKQGYTEHNYWRGDWWKVKSEQVKPKSENASK